MGCLWIESGTGGVLDIVSNRQLRFLLILLRLASRITLILFWRLFAFSSPLLQGCPLCWLEILLFSERLDAMPIPLLRPQDDLGVE